MRMVGCNKRVTRDILLYDRKIQKVNEKKKANYDL